MATRNTVQLIVEVDEKGIPKLSKEIEALGGKLVEVEKKGAALGQGFTRSGRDIVQAATSGRVSMLALAGSAGAAVAGVAGLAAVAGKSVMAYAAFEDELNNVATLVDTNVVSMDSLAEGILAIDSALGPTSTNVKALYQAISAGAEPAKAVGLVASAAEFAAASLSDTFTAVDLGTTVMSTFGVEAEEAFRVLQVAVALGKTNGEQLGASFGRIASQASSAGVELSSVAEAIAFVTANGVQTAEAITGLSATIAELTKPAQSATVALKEMSGGAVDFAQLKQILGEQGFVGLMEKLTEVTGGAQEKLAQLFSSREVLNTLATYTKNMDAARDASQRFQDTIADTGLVHDAAAKTTNDLSSQFIGLKGDLDKVFIAIGEGTDGPLMTMLSVARDNTKAFRDLIAAMNDLPSIQDPQKSTEAAFSGALAKIDAEIAKRQATIAALSQQVPNGFNRTEGSISSAVQAEQAAIARLRSEHDALAKTLDQVKARTAAVTTEVKVATGAAGAAGDAIADLGTVSAQTRAQLAQLDIADAIQAGDVDAITAGFGRLRAAMVDGLDDGQKSIAELGAAATATGRKIQDDLAKALSQVSDRIADVAIAAAKLDLEEALSLGDSAKAAEAAGNAWVASMDKLNRAFAAGAVSAAEYDVKARQIAATFSDDIVSGADAAAEAQARLANQSGITAELFGDIYDAALELDIEDALKLGDTEEALRLLNKQLGNTREEIGRQFAEKLQVLAEAFGGFTKLMLEGKDELVAWQEALDIALENASRSAEDSADAATSASGAWGSFASAAGGSDLFDLFSNLPDLLRDSGDGLGSLVSKAIDAAKALFGLSDAADVVSDVASGAETGGYIGALVNLIGDQLPEGLTDTIDSILGLVGSLLDAIDQLSPGAMLTKGLGKGLKWLGKQIDEGVAWVTGAALRADEQIEEAFQGLIDTAFKETQIDEALREAFAGATSFRTDGATIDAILAGFDPEEISNEFRRRVNAIDFPLDALSEATRRNLAHGERTVMITGAEAAAAFLSPTFGAEAAAEIDRQLTSVYGELAAAQGLHGRDAEIFIDNNVSATIIGFQQLGLSAEEAAAAVLSLGESYGAWPGAVDVLATINHELDQMGGAQGAVIDALGSAIGVFDRQAGRIVGQAGSIQQAWENSGLPVEEFASYLREVIATTPGLAAMGPALEPMIVALETGNVEAERLQATLDGFAATSTGIADAMAFLREFSLGTGADGETFLRVDGIQNQIDAIDRQIESAESAGNRELVIRLTADRTDLENQLAQAQSDLDLFNRAFQEQVNNQLGIIRADEIITPEEAAGLVSILQSALTEGGDALDESSRNLIRNIYSQLRFELGMTEQEIMGLFSGTELENIVAGIEFPTEDVDEIDTSLDGAAENAERIGAALGLTPEMTAALTAQMSALGLTMGEGQVYADQLLATLGPDNGIAAALSAMGSEADEQGGISARALVDVIGEGDNLILALEDITQGHIDAGREGTQASDSVIGRLQTMGGPMSDRITDLTVIRDLWLEVASLASEGPGAPPPPSSGGEEGGSDPVANAYRSQVTTASQLASAPLSFGRGGGGAGFDVTSVVNAVIRGLTADGRFGLLRVDPADMRQEAGKLARIFVDDQLLEADRKTGRIRRADQRVY